MCTTLLPAFHFTTRAGLNNRRSMMKVPDLRKNEIERQGEAQLLNLTISKSEVPLSTVFVNPLFASI
jgi:hypothetical protein